MKHVRSARSILILSTCVASACAQSTNTEAVDAGRPITNEDDASSFTDASEDVRLDVERGGAVFTGYDATPPPLDDAGTLNELGVAVTGPDPGYNGGYLGTLRSLWAAGPDDIWAVGPSPSSPPEIDISNGSIWHFNGTQWSPVTGDFSSINPELGIYSNWGFPYLAITGLAPSHQIFIGEFWGRLIRGDYTLNESNDPTITFVELSSIPSSVIFPDGTTRPDITHVWANATDDVWALSYSKVQHWDGATFSAPESLSPYPLNGLWGTASNDIWVVGQAGLLMHWDGSSWTTRDAGLFENVLSIRGISSQDIWAGTDLGSLLHFDGSLWTVVSHCCQADFYPPMAFPGNGLFFRDLFVENANDIWAGGIAGAFHWDGQSWGLLSVPGGRPADIWSIVSPSPNHYLVAGPDGIGEIQ